MKSAATDSQVLPDICHWSVSDRRTKLSKGTRIGVYLIDMPLPLLTACSSKIAAHMNNNKVFLPRSVDGKVAMKLLKHFVDLSRRR